jgi:hypothetical protein
MEAVLTQHIELELWDVKPTRGTRWECELTEKGAKEAAHWIREQKRYAKTLPRLYGEQPVTSDELATNGENATGEEEEKPVE